MCRCSKSYVLHRVPFQKYAKEDNDKADKAAKIMSKRMNEKILEGQIVTEENLGIKAMIGAIVLSTDAHICGAPMAAYHTRK